MSLDAWLAILATVGALAAMGWARVAPDRALLAALIFVMLTGIVEPARAVSGLANEGVITVSLLFVVAAAVRRSGALESIVSLLLGRAGGVRRAHLRLMLPVAGFSAFLNNTPVVAMLIPEVRKWAREHRIASSQLLIPLSYAAIVGGMCTMIGTSTNLLIDGLLVERGHERLPIFWISAVGVPAAAAAILVMILLGKWLLPRRDDSTAPLAAPREFTAELVVEASGPMVGKRLADVSVPGLRAFAPLEIHRGDAVIAAPRADEILLAGDRLIFTAPSAEILAVHRVVGLHARDEAAEPGKTGLSGALVEAVVGRSCSMVGREVGDGSFRRAYGAAVIAVARAGKRLTDDRLGTWKLEVGDTLLLEATPEFVERHRFGNDLILVTNHGAPRPHAEWHKSLSLLILLGMVVAAASGAMSMLMASLGATCVFLIAGAVGNRPGFFRFEDIAGDVDWGVLVAIVAAVGLGATLQDTGAASTIAARLVSLAGAEPWLALAMVYLATAVTTEFVTNNAAAVLMLPIALGIADDLQVSSSPFVAVVMIAASASFVTPIGYQTNLMVFGPGSYRLVDFVRVGLPVTLAVATATLWLTPLIWPF